MTGENVHLIAPDRQKRSVRYLRMTCPCACHLPLVVLDLKPELSDTGGHVDFEVIRLANANRLASRNRPACRRRQRRAILSERRPRRRSLRSLHRDREDVVWCDVDQPHTMTWPAFQTNRGACLPFTTTGVAGISTFGAAGSTCAASDHEDVIRHRIEVSIGVDHNHRTVQAQRQLPLIVQVRVVHERSRSGRRESHDERASGIDHRRKPFSSTPLQPCTPS